MSERAIWAISNLDDGNHRYLPRRPAATRSIARTEDGATGGGYSVPYDPDFDPTFPDMEE